MTTLKDLRKEIKGTHRDNVDDRGTLCIDRMEFKSVRTGETCYGFFIYDDVYRTYAITTGPASKEPRTLFEEVLDVEDCLIEDMIDSAKGNGSPLMIDDVEISWEDLGIE